MKTHPLPQFTADAVVHRHWAPGGPVHELLQILLGAVQQHRGHGLERLVAAVHSKANTAATYGATFVRTGP
ncbi:hypothetical protein G3I32_20990 [Streptomyces coelicoflavus]|uniref:Uncharacterized protein n=1 Tax=Streptomyces coelicoflavus TaxID=285562 RepID=A0A7K3PMU9_9ACTN|nr:hypothetical protein [Streptomyces coelicoflavus]